MKKLNKLKIIFIGNPFFAQEILRSLHENKIPIAYAVSAPDRPSGRKKIPKAPAVKIFALKKNIKTKQFKKLDEQAISFFQKQKPSLILVAAYGMILPKPIIELPPFGCINIHPSALPKHRGPSPIQASLLRGEKSTATTIMLMNEKMDAGDILAQKPVRIGKNDLYENLEKKIIAKTNEILIPTLEQWINGKIKPVPQDQRQATFTKIISKNDGRIIWSRTANEIFNQYRAFHKWPKLFCFWRQKSGRQNDEKKIILSEISHNPKNLDQKIPPGKVILREKESISVQTGKGHIIIKKIQLEGKKEQTARQFLCGYPQINGSILL